MAKDRKFLFLLPWHYGRFSVIWIKIKSKSKMNDSPTRPPAVIGYAAKAAVAGVDISVRLEVKSLGKGFGRDCLRIA